MTDFLKHTRWIVFACVLSISGFWGCGLKYQKKTPPTSLLSGKETISQLLKKRNFFHNSRSRAAITINRQGEKQTFGANIVLDTSSRFRIEGLGFLNTPFFFLIADGKWIWFYIPDEHKIVKGEYTHNALFRLTGIQSRVEDLIALFSGNLPYSLSSAKLKNISVKNNQQIIELQSEQKELYRLWIHSKKRALIKLEVYGANRKPLLRASFKDYKTIDDYNWPYWIECNFLPSKILLRIKYKQIFVNPGVTKTDFLLQYPKTTIIENLKN